MDISQSKGRVGREKEVPENILFTDYIFHIFIVTCSFLAAGEAEQCAQLKFSVLLQ